MQRTAIEEEIGQHVTAGELDEAATLALESYGNAIYGYLLARASNEGDAAEIFSEFCEDFWVGLPAFRGESSIKTWAYRLARNALSMFYRTEGRRARRRAPLSAAGEIERISIWIRTQTKPYQRTETKTWVARIREELRPAERELLTLHVDHQLTFRECAEIMLEGDEEPTNSAVRRLERTLRKRYQRTREKIRDMAVEQGLIEQ